MSAHSKGIEFKATEMLELIKDYDLAIYYHQGKVNVVADALSEKLSITLAYVRTSYLPQLLTL